MKITRQILSRDAAQHQAVLGRAEAESEGFALLRHSQFPAPQAPICLNHWLLPSGFLVIGEENEGLILTEALEAIAETAFFTNFSRGVDLDLDPADSVEELSDVFIGVDYGMRRNVYHMLILSLAKYACMEAILPSPVDFVVPSPDMPGTLAVYGGAVAAYRGRRLRPLKSGVYRLRNAHYMTVEGDNPAFISLFPNVLAALSAVYDGKPSLSAGFSRNIYVSRRRSPDPRISTQEASAIEALQDRYSIEPVAMEDLPFQRQLELFRAAGLIIGPHGAGLSFAVFAQAQALFIELNGAFYGESHRRPWFGLLTLHNACEYYEVVANAELSRTDQLAAILREKFGAG